MSVTGWNVGVLAAIGSILVSGTTQREKPVVTDASHHDRVSHLERTAAANPKDPGALSDLAQAYLDLRQPGMAIGAIKHAPRDVRHEPTVEHLYARALLDQGRSADALAAERRVLDTCASPPTDAARCSSFLIASATRRATIIEQLVELGVEDARAEPEASRLAFHYAARRISVSPQD